MLNVKLSLCLIRQHAVKAYGRIKAWLHIFLITTLDGGEWSDLQFGCFIPGELAPGTHWIGGPSGPRAGVKAVAKRKIPFRAKI
jgi:hypothetical protein